MWSLPLSSQSQNTGRHFTADGHGFHQKSAIAEMKVTGKGGTEGDARDINTEPSSRPEGREQADCKTDV